MNAKTQSLPFDPEALGRKYREERDKRLRADGNDQHQEVTGEFAYFVEDPYIDSELKREAIEEEVEVVEDETDEGIAEGDAAAEGGVPAEKSGDDDGSQEEG